MKRLAFFALAAFLIIERFGGAAWAFDWSLVGGPQQDVYASTSRLPLVTIGDCADGCDFADGCSDCCCSIGWIGTAELAFLKYGRADGVRVGVGAGDEEDFDFEITPRLTLGWVGASGLGARFRYWEFDHASNDDGDGDQLLVDTYTVDFELFEIFLALNDVWNMEVAGGIRYNEFEEQMIDLGAPDVLRFNSFHGAGGVASVELRRLVGAQGTLFTRARGALFMDDKDVFNDQGPQSERLNDVTVGTLELAIGYDYIIPLASGAVAFVRTQAEWQNWYNYTSSFVDTSANESFGGPSDVSFSGVGIALGIMR